MSQHVFFDLDGTLTDPYTGIRRSIEYALCALGVDPAPDDDFRWCIGPPLTESFERLVGRGDAAEALRLYRERYADRGWRENSVYPGIREAISVLGQRAHCLYVATSKPRIFAERILMHFDLSEHFIGIYGAELDGRHSDKASLLRFALQREGLGEACMIGDRRHDIEGALANGMRAIGVSYGFGSVEELQRAGASRILASPADIANLF